jgi:hypothetical protein
MVIYSNEIKDFLDKIYFYELTHRSDLDFSLYNYYKDNLRVIDKMSNHTPSTTFPMSRDGLFGLIIGRLEFGYSFDGTNASVEYYINREPQNDWFDWLIKESKRFNKKGLTCRELANAINERAHKSPKSSIIRLTEKDLRNIIRKCIKEIIGKDYTWDRYSDVPIAYNTTMRLADNNRPVKSLVTLCGRDTDPNEWRWDIIEDDGCYAICNNRKIQRNMYIFPELHKALKELPILPPH